MKRLSIIGLIVLTILALSMTLLPVQSSLAKKNSTMVNVSIRNRTGGNITLVLVDEKGLMSNYAYEPGDFKLTIAENNYEYYASTPCGNQAGSFNLSVSKLLFLSCHEVRQIQLTRLTIYCYPVYDYYYLSDRNIPANWYAWTTVCPGRSPAINAPLNLTHPQWGPSDYYFQQDLNLCIPPLFDGEGYAYQCKK